MSLGTISRKNQFFKTVLHFHLSHLSRKKSNLKEGFSARLSIFHSTWSKGGFQENLFCFVKNYMFSSLLEIQTKLLKPFWKKSKIYVHWIIFVEWNVIAQVFHFPRKYFPIISFGILTDETSKRRIKISKGFPKLYSTCPDDFNHIKHVYFPKKQCISRNLCFRSFTRRIPKTWCKMFRRMAKTVFDVSWKHFLEKHICLNKKSQAPPKVKIEKKMIQIFVICSTMAP